MENSDQGLLNNSSLSTIEFDETLIYSRDKTYKDILCDLQVFSVEKEFKDLKITNNFQKQQRFGIVYYILDGFQNPINHYNIFNMKEMWESSDTFKYGILREINSNELVRRVIQEQLDYSDINKIILVLSTQRDQYNIFSRFGQILNSLILEKFNTYFKASLQKYQENQIRNELIQFLSQIIQSLKKQSKHLYFPIILEDFNKAIECHLNVISSSLKTIITLFPHSIEDLVTMILIFLQKAYPISFKTRQNILNKYVNYFTILIKKLLKYCHFPNSFIDSQKAQVLSEMIINKYLTSINE